MRSAPFFPKADAVVLSTKLAPPPPRPGKIWPIFDDKNYDEPIAPWLSGQSDDLYPSSDDLFAAVAAPEKQVPLPHRYLRAFLTPNERLRLGMLWYYTRGILEEDELISGLQEKAQMAQESTGWEYVVIGLLDVNYYIRLSTIGLPLAILSRGETICAHTVTRPPGSVFLVPSLMEDWRFQECPYVEAGGLRAYAGAPLRLQNDSGDCVGLGSICVASSTTQPPLTKTQQQQLVRLGDWIVSDIIQCARARRQRERRQMGDLLSIAQREVDQTTSDESVLRIARQVYKDAGILLLSPQGDRLQIGDDVDFPLSEISGGLWENAELIDDFIANSNQKPLPTDKIVRIIAVPCETVTGQSLLVVASKDFQLVFDDVDLWFIEGCANLLSRVWRERLLQEAVEAKEKFLRGFSHQLRTPLHGILGSAELLAEELMAKHIQGYAGAMPLVESDSDQNNSLQSSVYLETIRLAGRDLVSIINNMINMNRWADVAISARHYASHNLDDLETLLATSAQNFTKGDSRFQSRILFHHDISMSGYSFTADIKVLCDSILPLIINAVQHTKAGIVLITTGLNAARKELVVGIRDTGVGIHSDNHQRIFQPYEKVDDNSAGAGLGLTLASKFATLHHGTVTLVSSQLGHGSFFQVSFEDIKSTPPASISPPCMPKFHSLPCKWYIDAGELETSLLNEFMSSVFGNDDVIRSDDVHNSIVISLFNPSVPLPPLSTNQVAICLAPFETNSPLPQPSTTFHINGPVTAATVHSALQEVDNSMAQLQSSSELIKDYKSPDGSTAVLTESPDARNLALNRDGDSFVTSIKPSKDILQSSPAINATLDTPTPLHAVLVVDDNMVNMRILQMYCKKRSLKYYSASDCQEAVRIFEEQQALMKKGKGLGIQLILMDLQMPICDGFTATKQIRQLEQEHGWKRSTLFIITGQDSLADRETAKGIGAQDYFVKPVGLKILDKNIRQYFLGFWVN